MQDVDLHVYIYVNSVYICVRMYDTESKNGEITD